ncbi:MAG: transglutaminase domain-containing protein [Planctomycetes bacterium]|nr:transglutaminase domain-containing protein [Planctomycetota bacterium]
MDPNLKPYIGRGFPGNLDELIATCPVKDPDLAQTQGMVRLCNETSAALYGDYSPTAVRYRNGSRPALEKITAAFTGATPRQRVAQAMEWTARTVVHPHMLRMLAPDRGMTEEQLIGSGTGWCNEQSRVFIALCEVMGIPARICFVFHDNLRCGHTCAEVYLDGRWVFHDVTFRVVVTKPDGTLAEGRELNGPLRDLAHKAYRPALAEYYAKVQPYVETCPGWRSADRPSVDRGGDLLGYMGICNYIVEGVEAVTPAAAGR